MANNRILRIGAPLLRITIDLGGSKALDPGAKNLIGHDPGPNRPKGRPRTAQEAPKTAQKAAKTAREVPKTAQEAPKTAQEAPKTPPRGPQDGPGGLGTIGPGSGKARGRLGGADLGRPGLPGGGLKGV